MPGTTSPAPSTPEPVTPAPTPVPTTYTVSFSANNGEGSMDTVTVDANSAWKIPANTFVYEGHIFKGWNTAADGSGDQYKDEQEVKDLTKPTGSVTLYAQWQARTNSWYNNNGKWNWYNAEGVKATGWTQISDTWYWFDDEGVMVTGLKDFSGTWYHFAESGAMSTGWVDFSGT